MAIAWTGTNSGLEAAEMQIAADIFYITYHDVS